MKKETEEQLKKAIFDLSNRVTSLEDEISLAIQLGKMPRTNFTFDAIQNPDGTLSPVQKQRTIVIS